MRNIQQHTLVALLVAGLMSGCATSQNSSTSAEPKAKASSPAQASGNAGSASVGMAPAEAKLQTYFLVFHENGRIYAMTEPKIYLGLLEHGEVPLTRSRIGGGPEGETVIFGITKEDGKHLDKPTAAEDIFDGRVKDLKPFYAEVVRNGRYHVFGEWKDFQDYLAHKEITFTYTEVGAGPKGETVVYALNSETKKKGRPLHLVEQFNKIHQTK